MCYDVLSSVKANEDSCAVLLSLDESHDRCQLPASIGPCVVPAFACVIPPDLFMLKTKSCIEVVQATKLRVICARDLEHAGKLVDGQWYSLSKASFFSKTKTTSLGSWAMYLETCGQDNAEQGASASSKKSTKQ
ncbi:uncharacterized protein LOC144118165 [Amblyomma americanum]